MKIEGDRVLFECSGRRDYSNGGILGISPRLETSGGYDQGLPCDGEDSHGRHVDEPFTQAEREELADYAISLWKAYRAAAPEQPA